MNEVALHKGSSLHLSANGTTFVDGQHRRASGCGLAGYGYVASE
jgi:hypothetical protein